MHVCQNALYRSVFAACRYHGQIAYAEYLFDIVIVAAQEIYSGKSCGHHDVGCVNSRTETFYATGPGFRR